MKNMKKKTTIFLLTAGALLLITVLWAALSTKNLPDCRSYSYYECPTVCAVCPPCKDCNSIGCQTEKYCTSIGFNKSWYEGARPK